jgi:uncharacterized protein YjbJ (UPF0337 family)
MKTRIDSGMQRRQNMNWDEAGNNLEHFKSLVQERWNSLSEQEVEEIAGHREKLLEVLQRTYSLTPDEAEAEIRRFETGDPSVAGTSSGRGPTERMREFGAGNETGDLPRADKHQLH